MKTKKRYTKFYSEIIDVMNVAFDLQETYFTSNTLSNTVRELLSDNNELFDVMDKRMRSGYIAEFMELKKDEIQKLTPKQFKKINKQKEIISNSSKIDEAIKLLKSAGYKVLKQTITFDEI